MAEGDDGRGVYFDGLVNRKRGVMLRFGETLEIAESGVTLATWPYRDIREIPAVDGVMRLRAEGGAMQLAQLDIADAETQARVKERCPTLHADQSAHDGATLRIVGWSLAAAASVFGLIFFGAPLAAERVAPLVPVGWEKRFGEAAEGQVRTIFDGKSCASAKGSAALAKLSQRLQDAAKLRIPASLEVMQVATPNAFALPGGKVFLLSGLLDKAQSQDEIVGVLAHELGHLEHRDHLRRMIADGGVAWLFGLLFGDVTGGGAIVFASKTLLSAAHSREAETDADAFAAQTLASLGRPAKPLGEMLIRITGSEKNDPFAIFNDHPMSDDRLAKLAMADKGATRPSVLSDDEWKALKAICK